ncbi:hypothetical protein NPX79_00980 [Spiroplasma endosymbiont of Anurida maritima]|uniref:hypothetical protein n=1 Tax=Spiroplasma endosymbiont of Anurida maritima TaxID=2967972 RepID=UPI0036D2EDE3
MYYKFSFNFSSKQKSKYETKGIANYFFNERGNIVYFYPEVKSSKYRLNDHCLIKADRYKWQKNRNEN